jgi:ADP-ribose pyrophosphatase
MTCQGGLTAMTKPIVPRQIRRIYQGRVFTVQVETVTLPNGSVLDAEIIRHPGSVVIVPVTEHGDIILVRQYRHAIGRFAWELPAGSLKLSEDAADAARRECQEEVGLVPGRLTPLGSCFPTPGYCDEEMNFFRADGLREPRADETARPDDDEDIEARAFSRAAVQQMVAAGEIIDLKTIAGLALLDSRAAGVQRGVTE